jgi:hypothetical protein
MEKTWLFGIFRDRPHIWRRFVSRIANPTYIWRMTTLIPKEPKTFLDDYIGVLL